MAGTLRLRCTREFSTRLAANLLGTDVGDAGAEQQPNDAVKEFVNIVCGQFITAAHGTEEVFNLTIPKIAELPDTPDLSARAGVEVSVLSVDGQFVQLSHLPEGEQPPAQAGNATLRRASLRPPPIVDAERVGLT